jgi:hypothetical protein
MKTKKVGKHLIDSYEDWREYITIHHQVTRMKNSIKKEWEEARNSISTFTKKYIIKIKK